MIDFAQHYKTVPAHELLEIIEYPFDYQETAIQAAKQELQQRQLSETQLSEAREIMLIKRAELKRAQQRIQTVQTNAINTGRSWWTSMTASSLPDRDLEIVRRWICALFALLFLYWAVVQYKYMLSILTYVFSEPLTIFDIWPFVVMPMGTIGFWMRKRWGWVLLAIYAACNASEILLLTSYGNFINPMYDITDYRHHIPSLWYFVMLNLYCGTLYFLCRKDVRQHYGVSKSGMFRSVAFGMIFALFVVIVIYRM